MITILNDIQDQQNQILSKQKGSRVNSQQQRWSGFDGRSWLPMDVHPPNVSSWVIKGASWVSYENLKGADQRRTPGRPAPIESQKSVKWVCLKIVYPIVPNGFADHYPY